MATEEHTSSKEMEEQKIEYPSAELLQGTCYEDYRRVLDTYDKIYEKVNIALAFSGVILLVIVSNFDYTIIRQIIKCDSNLELFSLISLGACSLTSAVLILWAVIHLLFLMRSKQLTVFDSMSISSEELYRETVDVSSMWLIQKYTQAISILRPAIENKQKAFDKAVLRIIIAILCYAVSLIIEKGL